MNNKQLKAKVAVLESQVDHLESELSYIHKLLINFGFSEGVNSLKKSLEEILTTSSHI